MFKELIINAVLLLLNLGACAVLLRGLWQIFRAWQTSHWESTPGRIATAEIHEVERKTSKNKRATFEVKTKYQYMVCGQSYEGETIAASYQATSIEQEHRDVLAWLENASSVRVFYDPLHPEQSVLLPGIDRGTFGTLAIGIVCLAITGGLTGMYLLIFGEDPAMVQSIVML